MGWPPCAALPQALAWVGWPPPSVTPVLGAPRVPLTNDDFRAYRASMPTPHMIGPATRPYAAPTEEPCPSNAVYARDDIPRSPWARCTRRQTAILASNAPPRPDYRTIVLSGSAASAAPALPPNAPLSSLRVRPPRLHDPTESSCLTSADAGAFQPPVGPLATYNTALHARCGSWYPETHGCPTWLIAPRLMPPFCRASLRRCYFLRKRPLYLRLRALYLQPRLLYLRQGLLYQRLRPLYLRPRKR